MKHITLFGSALALSLMAAATQDALAYKQENVSILVNGKSRNMVVFTPDVVSDNLPLMIVTHGMNQSPEYQYDADKIYQMVDDEQFIVTYLRSVGNTWDTGGTSDQRFVELTITEMNTRYGIDPHRVYWSGFSMGSMLIYHCMHNMQGKIAAFAPTSGIQFSEQPWNKCKKPVNLIHCHAYADDVFNYDSYGIRDYVVHMADMNNYTSYDKFENYNPGGWYTGDKEVWTNDAGNKVELFSYNNGGHWPQQANGYEIWNFCKEYSIPDEELDPLAEPELPADYTVDLDAEVLNEADRLNGRTLFATDVDCQSMWYVNTDLESPQNVRVGSYNEIQNNPYCWLKFTKVTLSNRTPEGTFYTIQMADQSGANYSLWGSQGYLNTPPGEWCLFALGLENRYGQDAENYGLWELNYEEGHGYTLRNVGAADAGGNPWAYPSEATPVANKGYLRLFSKLKKVETGIQQIQAEPIRTTTVNLMGQPIAEPTHGIFIRDGKKCIMR